MLCNDSIALGDNMCQFLILGGDGLLGATIKNYKELFNDSISFNKKQLDITDYNSLHKAILKYQPTYVINCAAMTNVDLAQKQYNNAFNVNSEGVRNLKFLSSYYNFKLIHISSNYVFNNGIFDQNAPTNPINAYGLTKSIGQMYCNINKDLIIRTSWVFGINGNNFISKAIEILKNNKQINVVSDQVSRLTYVDDLVLAIYNLKDNVGIYNFTNIQQCTKYEFFCQLNKLLNTNCIVNQCKGQAYNTLASRPSISILNTDKYQQLYKIRNWKDTLNDYIDGKILITK